MASAAVSGTTTTYTYDGFGQRVEKSGSKLYWYGPSGEVLAESDLSGNILSEYIYFNGQRIARRDPNVSGGANVYYYLSDRLGSAKQIVSIGLNGTLNGCNTTTPTGCIVAESDYYPYGGERVVTSDATSNTYKYTSHERDTETGLDHTDNRQYSSNTGRWLAADPSKGSASFPQSWNRYAYVLGNSTNNFDHTGGTCVIANTDGDCLLGDGEDTVDDGEDGPTCEYGTVMLNPGSGETCGQAITLFLQSRGIPAGPAASPPCPETIGISGTTYYCIHQSGSDWNELEHDLKHVEKRLAKDTTCDNLLTSAGTSLTSIDNDLSNPNMFYSLATDIVPPNGSPIAGTTNDLYVGTPFVLASGLFSQGNQEQADLTILHEMAHYTDVFGPENVAGNPSSATNDQTIGSACQKTLANP